MPMASTMAALTVGPESTWKLREVPVPEPGPGQVLVAPRAVALNNADLAELDAGPPDDQSGARVAGYEFAGQVAAVGPGVAGTAAGERVMGTAPASFAPYVVVDHRHLLPIPEGLAFPDAATLPTGLLTEHGALRAGGFQPDQTVLITGASSGIGLLGVQIAHALGAGAVLVTTRTAAKTTLLRDAGADAVLVTGNDDLTEQILKATGGAGADLVLDHMGGQTFADLLPATRIGGSLVNLGRLDRAASTVDLDALSCRNLTVRGVSFGFTRPESSATSSPPRASRCCRRSPMAASVRTSTPSCRSTGHRRRPIGFAPTAPPGRSSSRCPRTGHAPTHRFHFRSGGRHGDQ